MRIIFPCFLILVRGAMLQQQEAGRLVVPVSMIEAINQFSDWRKLKIKGGSVKGYDRELRNFCLFLRNPMITQVTFNDVMEYLNGIVELGWNPNSLLPRSMALRKFFEFMRLQGITTLNEDLIPIPQQQFTIPRVADKGNYDKLIQSIPGTDHDSRHIRNLAIINMLWDTGARNGEICSLNLADVDIKNKKALIRTEKNRGSRPFREIFWTEGTNINLISWIKKREVLNKKNAFVEPEAFFVSLAGRRPGLRFTVRGIGEMLRQYCNRAKLPYLNPHSFRHHMGHDIIWQGGSVADVMNILGHVDPKSSSVYTAMNDRELERRYRTFKGD